MKKNILLIILAILFINISISYCQYTNSKIPKYLKPEYKEYYLNHSEIVNPLLNKVKWAPIPPEWAKYKPETTRLLNSEGFELINITNGNDAQSETWIAINPTNPLNIVATANDNNYLGGKGGWRMNSWYTLDGGKNWTSSPTPPNLGVYINAPTSGSMTIFDPGIAFDAEGRLVYTYGYTQILSSGTTDGDNGVFAVSSTDGGQNWYGWGKDYPISAIALSSNEPSSPFHDRYTLGCDNVSNTNYRNRFYITWQRFQSNPGISFSYSTDYGASWSSPSIIGTGSTQAPMPTVGPDGEVYVSWINNVYPDEAQAIVRKSTNGGANWGNTILAQSVYSIGTRNSQSSRFTLTDKQGIRVSSPPQIAVDCSNGNYRGYVYVVQAGRESSGGLNHIYVSRSQDGGKTWKKMIVDDNKYGNDMFFPSITVDPKTGVVAVFYYSSQNDPQNNQGVDGYISFSKDGGNTWNVLRVTPTTWYLNGPEDVMPQGDPGNIYWGDYTSITSYDGVIYPLFWMPTSPTGNYFSLDLFTAPISSNPAPVSNLKAENIFEGNSIKVKLSWTNPEFDLLKNPLGDFNVVIYRDDIPNNPIASINKSQPSEFYDANVVDGNFYTYSLKVVTSDNKRESTVSKVSILVGGALKPNPPSSFSWRPLEDGVLLSWINPSKSIDGSNIRGFDHINIYVNDTLQEAVTQSQDLAGLKASYKLNMSPKTFAKIQITAVASRNEKSEESDYTQPSIVYAGPIYTTFSENFDDVANIIPHYVENGWDVTSKVSKSAPNSIAASPKGKYQINKNYELYLPPMIVTAANQSLLFDHICLVHNTDIAQVSATKDWGNYYKGLRWYDINSSPDFIRGDLANSKWQSTAADLRPFIGDTIMLRFSLFSGPALTDEGWFIDNIHFDNSVGITEHSLESVNSIIIYPNPTSEVANVEFSLNKETNLSIEILDLLGNRLLFNDSGKIVQSQNNIQLDLKDLPSGTYYIRLNFDNQQVVKAISVMK